MNNVISYLIFLFCFLIFSSCSKKEKRVLIFSKTVEFRHNSIEAGVASLKEFIESKNIQVDTTENAAYFVEDSLKHYSSVIFLNTTGNVLDNIQQADFERYIQAGGGFVGIHAATDTEYNWQWYNKLVGAYFDGHPAIQDANLDILKKEDPCCQHLPESWSLNEEWYNFKSVNPDIEVLVEIDESSYEGGTNGEKHPMVWKPEYDGGRSFYTAIGHKEETFSDSFFLQQVFAGLEYTIGNNKLDYTKARRLRVPEENRFTKEVLDFNLDEPMELDELGNRGIIYIERRGALKLYDYQSEQIISLDSLAVHDNDEDGLLGLAVDPNYLENQWIYLFYSPDIEKAVQYISRFTLRENKLTDEKILLEIPLIRECCHSGGSLEFGKDGLLYIGVGDNTNPFESAGYAPIDEQEGRELFDAQRTAANTNDLRGKILRIKPEVDGTYSIPEGNLFAEGTEKCRPEIFVMGLRNPFRFSIDSKKGHLYWGDVGPDAGEEDSLRGPKGMGEFNLAQKAGFYGWPYSRGNNQMYWDYNFANEESNNLFDPNQIINNSPNNTGLQELPPIQESMIWYNYGNSTDFPWLGAGGVNPMSGPIYHAADYSTSESSFPPYFENKWFVYEWMRDWIYVVHLDENDQFIQADPFMPKYGQKWNSRNMDARLSVIRFNSGNRPPIARFAGDKEVGAAPLSIRFSAAASLDYDDDEIKYHWSFGGVEMTTDSSAVDFTFEDPGIYEVELSVSDLKGASASTSKKILVGNEPPQIEIELSDENTTYWEDKEMNYKIHVSDLEDGNTSDASLDLSKVKVTLNYIPQGDDIILASIGHQQNVVPRGLELINSSGCKACHAINEKVAGPSYQAVAERYGQEDKEQIIRRIIKGSQGIWGEKMMAAHPQLEIEEVDEIVNYILSLDADNQGNAQNIPLEGSIAFDKHFKDAEAGKYILMASYLDKGNPDIENSALSVVEKVIFRAPKMEMEDAFELDKELGIWENQNRTLVGSIKDGKQIKFQSVSIENLKSITIGAAFSKNYSYYGELEVRLGERSGPLLGEGIVEYFDKEKDDFKTFKIELKEHANVVDNLVLVFKNPSNKDQFAMNGDWLQLNYGNISE